MTEASIETQSDISDDEDEDSEETSIASTFRSNSDEASDDGQSSGQDVGFPVIVLERESQPEMVVCSGIVAARCKEIMARTSQIKPADTWQIREGIVPEMRKQWSRGNVAGQCGRRSRCSSMTVCSTPRARS